MSSSYTLEEIAGLIGGQLSGDGQKSIAGVAPMEAADDAQITYAGGRQFLKQIEMCQAGAIIVPAGTDIPDRNLVAVDNPKLAFAHVMALFYPPARPVPGIDPMASLGSDLKLGTDLFVGAFVTVGNRAALGAGTIVHNGSYIGEDVVIGEHCLIHPNVTILPGCCIGNRVIIHSGTVIGSDGYGFVPDKGRYHKIPQVGMVQIDDDVEIGACNAIDRATYGRTWLQRGVKTDNLVHIAHNVVVGEDSVVVAQVGIAGSSQIGHHAILAGQAGISDHVTLGNHVVVGPMTGVGQDLEDGQIVSSGTTAMPHRTWLRVQRIIPSLPEMKKKIGNLEKKIADLEKNQTHK